MPQRGPEASQRTSLAIFISAAASCVSAPLVPTKLSCPPSAANLLGALMNVRPLISLIFSAARSAYLGWRVEAGAHRRAADRELLELRQGELDGLERVVELRDPAADLLAERHRRGVLQVRAADLDDVGERLGLLVERVAQLLHARDQVVLDLLDGGDVHRGRVRVVGRLRHVDVVVGVHGLLAAAARRPPARCRGCVMTSLTFMLLCVPEPVCQTTSGKWSSSLPAITSSAARTIRSLTLPSSRPSSWLASAAAFFRMPNARITSRGIFSVPILKFMQRALGLGAPVAVGRPLRAVPSSRFRFASPSLLSFELACGVRRRQA